MDCHKPQKVNHVKHILILLSLLFLTFPLVAEESGDLYFKKVDSNIFPVIKLKDRLDEYPSTPIIINAANEVLVDQFLKKKIPFLSIYKIIMNILNDRNYKKYAIKTPININQILKIDNWAKTTTKKYVK